VIRKKRRKHEEGLECAAQVRVPKNICIPHKELRARCPLRKRKYDKAPSMQYLN
jgi:hypothetical protein